MSEYRVYIIATDGRLLRSVELLCPDDEKAEEYAKQLVDGHAIELWQGTRKLARFDPEKSVVVPHMSHQPL